MSNNQQFVVVAKPVYDSPLIIVREESEVPESRMMLFKLSDNMGYCNIRDEMQFMSLKEVHYSSTRFKNRLNKRSSSNEFFSKQMFFTQEGCLAVFAYYDEAQWFESGSASGRKYHGAVKFKTLPDDFPVGGLYSLAKVYDPMNQSHDIKLQAAYALAAATLEAVKKRSGHELDIEGLERIVAHRKEHRAELLTHFLL